MEQKLTYNQVLTLLEVKTHFVICWFSIFGKDEQFKRKFLSPMKLQMYLLDNRKYLEKMFVCTSKPPYVTASVDIDSVKESFYQLDLFDCPTCHE